MNGTSQTPLMDCFIALQDLGINPRQRMRSEQGVDKAEDADLLIGTSWTVKTVCN